MRKFILIVLILALGGVFWTYSKFASKANGSSNLITTKASKGDIEDSTTALGTLQPLNYVDVGTSVSGQLRKITVAIGNQVKEGDLLAEIDPTIYAAKVDAARAQLEALKAQQSEKQAQYSLAQEQYARQERMLKANATSQDAYQSAQALLKTSQAQVAQLRAQIGQVESTLRADEANLGYTKIYAPMKGTVVSQTARQGQTLNANQQAPIILRIADLNTMTVWTQVSEADVNKLKIGQDVYFTTLGQPEKRWYSKLRQIIPTPEIVNNVVLYNALFDVENPNGELGIQMSAQVFFVHAAAKEAILIPASALSKGKKPSLQVVKEGSPEPREVKLGVRNRVQVQILEGLAEGEEVIIGNKITEAKKAQTQGGPPGGGVYQAGGAKSR